MTNKSSSSIEVLLNLLKRKRFIGIFVGVTTLAALVVSLLLPKWYLSSVSLLPPRNQGLMGGLGGLTALLGEVTPGVSGGLEGAGYSYLAILNSRKAKEAVIKKFDLREVYDITDSPMEEVLEAFEGNYEIIVTEEGAVTIEIYDRDSLRAAAMADYMVHTLNDISIELGTREARSNRDFLAERVAETRRSLQESEDTLRHYQEIHGMIFLTQGEQSAVSSVGEFYARQIAADIQLSILKKTTGEENPAYKQLKIERDETSRKLSDFPGIGMESLRLVREVMINQKLLEFLLPLYEQARIEEQKDIPVMLVLDDPVPAEKKSRPKRMFIVASALLSSLVIATGFVLVAYRVQQYRMQNPQKYQEIMSLVTNKWGK